MRGLLGNIHQGNIKFRNAGVQCTAIAYYALAERVCAGDHLALLGADY